MTEVFLETERLKLRPVEPADAAHIELYVSDIRVSRMTTMIPHPYPPGSAAGFIASRLSDQTGAILCAITLKDAGVGGLIGLVDLEPSGDVGYWLGAPFWNKGFATEALSAVVDLARDQALGPLTASVFQDNPASARVLTKCGFDYVGEDMAYSNARAATVPVWSYRREMSA